MREAWRLYKERHPNSPSVNGRIFEYIICETLAQQGIVPLCYQAEFAQVPNASFDVVLYDEASPVVLSMKTSLRERYKQAGLEGMALRQVYRRARCYLITLADDEADKLQCKIDSGSIAGLDRCIVATRPEYTQLLECLAQRTFTIARPIQPLDGRTISGGERPTQNTQGPG